MTPFRDRFNVLKLLTPSTSSPHSEVLDWWKTAFPGIVSGSTSCDGRLVFGKPGVHNKL